MNRSTAFNRSLSAVALTALIAGCGGGGSSPGPRVTPTPVPTPTSVASDTTYSCAVNSSSAAVARSTQSDFSLRGRQARAGIVSPRTSTGLIAVTYSRAKLDGIAESRAALAESAANGRLVRELAFSKIGRDIRIVHVTPGTEATAIAKLRAQPDVLDATITGGLRAEQTVAQKYLTNDPYYSGFTQAEIVTAGSAGAPTYHVDPYEENSGVPGQWGMHATRLDYAQAYSQANNGSGVQNIGALGASNVKIAVIDSGEDVSLPELAPKIVYQKCFITNPSGVQSSSSFTYDQDGHGTDVSGIAAAAQSNGLGFTGSGGNASILAYRVFPTPDDTCVPGYTKTVDDQCFVSVVDLASAINDAVSQGAAVINMSLGGGSCSNGADPDSVEGAAIANALASNVVVVAASGNANDPTKASPGVAAPGCDTGVIAVGASALGDGVANGSSSSPAGSASSPVEYVASYSQFGSPAAAAENANAWGIVAPGGDPNGTTDLNDNLDELHWIENIWTSTPLDSSFEGTCSSDLGNPTGAADCRTLIAGTSQATPLVAGAVALIIAANDTYASPAKMKQLLCSTAHDIGDPHEGCGRIDIYRAMATVVGDPTLPASQ